MKYISKLSDLRASGKPVAISKSDVLFCRLNLNHLPDKIVYGNPSNHIAKRKYIIKSVTQVLK